MRPLIVIPARMGAVRLPGKPLALLGGVPMVIRCAAIARAAAMGPVLIAAAEPEIVACAHEHGFDAVLTDQALPSGTDRVFAALCAFDPAGLYDVVVNYQGDMPTLAPQAISRCLALLARAPEAAIATLAALSEDPEERADDSVVKAVVTASPGADFGRALYFTRAPAPSGPGPILHHLGLYAFRRDKLAQFVGAPASPLEKRERLEQLRAMEMGMTIVVGFEQEAARGVDTPADLARMEALFDR